MKINTIQNVNTNRINFKASEENIYKQTSEKVKDITDKYIESTEIKSPSEIALSMGLVALKTFICGAGAALLLASVFKSAPGKTQKVLKTVSNELVDFSKKVVSEPNTKRQKIGNFVKEAVGNGEKLARNAYKKVICRGFEAIPEGAEAKVIKEITDKNNLKAFTRLGGASALAALTPAIFKKDEDEDGVKDILQKAQKRSQQIDNKFNAFGEEILAVTQLSQMIK